MRANDSRGGRTETVTEAARREQIVAAAIETIAELGYGKASFARIAERAGLSSTGLISYHFKTKRALVERIVSTIYVDIPGFIAKRVEPETTAAGALRAYIEARGELAAARRTQMTALLAILVGGGLDYGESTERDAASPVEDILRWGQQAGEFRDFDVRVMATTIQRAVEGPTFLLAGEPGMDVATYTSELVTLFDLATRKGN